MSAKGEEGHMEAASNDIGGLLKFFLCLFNPIVLLAMMKVDWGFLTVMELIAAFAIPFVGLRFLIKGKKRRK